MAQNYEQVKTAQDVIDYGVIPKTSAETLSLIFYHRLSGLVADMDSKIQDETLGSWIPAIGVNKAKLSSLKASELGLYVPVGTPIILQSNDISGVSKGSVGKYERKYNDSQAVISFNGVNKAVEWSDIKFKDDIYVEAGIALTPGVIAKKDIGHLVRTTKELPVTYTQDGNTQRGQIPVGTELQFIGLDTAYGTGSLRADKAVLGRALNYEFKVADALSILEASSNGQEAPKDRSAFIKEAALLRLMPKVKLPAEIVERVVAANLIGKDQVYYGPAGAGKSQLAKDMGQIMGLMGGLFVVDSSKAQTSPFSIYDKDFAKKVIPDPEVMIFADDSGKFMETGRITPKKPKNVDVKYVKFGEGFGLVQKHGSIGMQPHDLQGSKLPKMDSTPASDERNDPRHPEGFYPAILTSGNNGMTILDEIEKIPLKIQDELLEALADNKTSPKGQQFPWPANSVLVGTANDHTKFSDPMRDRIAMISVPHPSDPDIAYSIIRSSMHGKTEDLTEIKIPDIHTMQPIDIDNGIIMPTITEKSLIRLFMAYEEKFTGTGKSQIQWSNRARFDAMRYSRAKQVIDALFDKKAPAIVSGPQAVWGIQNAIATRIYGDTLETDRESKRAAAQWLASEYDAIDTEESNTWWCTQLKDLAMHSARQKTDIGAVFAQQIDAVSQTPAGIHKIVEEAKDMDFATLIRENPLAKIVLNEPGAKKSKGKALEELAVFLATTYQGSSCKID